MSDTLEQRCRTIDMLLLDVDGVLTDGRIVYAEDGVEIKSFHVRDGTAVKFWLAQGKKAGIITGRESRLVERRGRELGMAPIVQGCRDKLVALQRVMEQTGLERERIAFMGDDLTDLPALRHCGLAAVPADACAEAIADAHYVARAGGGAGAVREVIELIMRCQQLWQVVTEHYRSQKPV